MAWKLEPGSADCLPAATQIRSNYFPKQSLNPCLPFIYLLAESFSNTEPCVTIIYMWEHIVTGIQYYPLKWPTFNDSTCTIVTLLPLFPPLFPLTSPQSPWLCWCGGCYSNTMPVTFYRYFKCQGPWSAPNRGFSDCSHCEEKKLNVHYNTTCLLTSFR